MIPAFVLGVRHWPGAFKDNHQPRSLPSSPPGGDLSSTARFLMAPQNAWAWDGPCSNGVSELLYRTVAVSCVIWVCIVTDHVPGVLLWTTNPIQSTSRAQTALVEPQCLEQSWMTPGMPDGTQHPHCALCEQSACGWAADSLTSCAGQELVPGPAGEICSLEWFECRRFCSVQ